MAAGDKDSKGRYLDPAAAIDAGLMKRKLAIVPMGGGIPRKVAGIVGEGAANVQKVYREISPAAQKAIDEARAILKSKKPTAEEMAKRARANKANEVAKIRNQGRNTR
jgi:hypothetical protein